MLHSSTLPYLFRSANANMKKATSRMVSMDRMPSSSVCKPSPKLALLTLPTYCLDVFSEFCNTKRPFLVNQKEWKVRIIQCSRYNSMMYLYFHVTQQRQGVPARTTNSCTCCVQSAQCKGMYATTRQQVRASGARHICLT